MKFYNDIKLLYLETDASRVGLGAALLQQHAKRKWHKTTQYFILLLLLVKVYQGQNGDTATSSEKHLAY